MITVFAFALPERALTVHKDTMLRISWLTALLLLAAAVLVRFSIVLATPLSELRNVVDFIYDDGYYYLTIAANLAQHGRSTLDGITATNGYQPAWLLVLAGLAKVVGTRVHAFFVASCALIYAIAAATPLLALLWRKSASRTVAFCLAAGLAVVMIQEPVVFLAGLEPILFPAVALVMVVLMERPTLDARSQLQLAAVLAAAFLVRLDALALYGTASLCLPLFGATTDALVPRSRFRQFVQLTARLSAVVLPTVLAYLAINQWLFGTAVPVSGRAKDVGGPFFSNWGISLAYTDHWKPIALLIAILLLLEFLARRLPDRPQPLLYRSIAVFGSATVIQYLYYAAFSTWLLWPWYVYLLAIDIALLIARIVYLASLLDYRRRQAWVAVAALLLIGGWALHAAAVFAFDSLPPETQWRLAALGRLGLAPSQSPGTLTQEQADLAIIRDFFASKPHTVIAMGDRAGGLAYWARDELSVIQTEGLTLGAGYLRARQANDGAQYLVRFPIDYYVVDREVIPTTQGAGGERIFVVADPIQGRVSRTPVPTFCFPESASRYQLVYSSWRGVSTRMAFDFSARVPCSAGTLARLRSIETGMGLRQYSLPSEYHGPGVSPRLAALEDRDRHFHGSDSAPDGFGRFTGGKHFAP
jgi:hypothetical protein